MSQAVRDAYRRGEDDETMEPIVLTDPQGVPVGRVGRGHCAVFYNIRGEREAELTRTFVEEGFSEFPVERLTPHFATMIEYDSKLKVKVAFPPEGVVGDTLSEIRSVNGF